MQPRYISLKIFLLLPTFFKWMSTIIWIGATAQVTKVYYFILPNFLILICSLLLVTYHWNWSWERKVRYLTSLNLLVMIQRYRNISRICRISDNRLSYQIALLTGAGFLSPLLCFSCVPYNTGLNCIHFSSEYCQFIGSRQFCKESF